MLKYKTEKEKNKTHKEILEIRDKAFKALSPETQAAILRADAFGDAFLKALNDTPREEQY